MFIARTLRSSRPILGNFIKRPTTSVTNLRYPLFCASSGLSSLWSTGKMESHCLIRMYSSPASTVTEPSMMPPSPPPHEEPPKTLTGKLKAFFRKYGKLGVAMYLSISAVTFSSIYLALRSGVDVKELMRKVGIPEWPLLDGAGTVAVAYAIYKLLMPARLFLTVILTTWISKRTRWGLPPSSFGKGEGKR